MGIEAIKISSREHILHTAMAGFDFVTLKVQNDLLLACSRCSNVWTARRDVRRKKQRGDGEGGESPSPSLLSYFPALSNFAPQSTT